ncbi:hypothetical protein FMEXI_11832 [Fusarium mexicanum]|uniref:Uncharacterized protein n=1 Tax=Fusarium mexicanum TaxID=751941 RepID=A0A8H5ICQ9_9HYPO|nr:hypothetical protein FMEXI_11832 [Fusarium mexicanum]
MDTKQELPIFDHLASDFNKVSPRRVHMERYFQALGLWNAEWVKASREANEEKYCTRLQHEGHLEVGHVYFEYLIDYGVWCNILSNAKVPYDDHPWPVERSTWPSPKDLSRGVSRFYQGWVRRDKSFLKSQGESSKKRKSEVSTPDTTVHGSHGQHAAEKSPAVAKNTVVRLDPSIPFAEQPA